MTAVRPSSRHARLDRLAERTGDRGGAVGAAERVERALAAVGHRHLVAVPAELERGVADRLGDGRTPTRCRGACRERRPRARRHAGTAAGAAPRVPVDTVGPPMAPASADRPIVLVSNRGPVSFEREDDGALTSKRGAGGLVSGIGPLAADGDVTWLAAAMSDDDREAASAGVVEADGFRVRLLDLDPEAFRLAYDVVSNEVLWFAHHGLWDLTREPAFDASWADAWDAYRAVNHAFADAVAEAAPDGAVVLVQDYHLCLVAARLRATAARPHAACTSTTRRSPRRCGCGALPDAAAPRAARGAGRPPRLRLPQPAVGRRLPQLGPRARRPRADRVRRAAGLRSRRHPRRGRLAGVRGRARRARGGGAGPRR